jgi:hypothetical protein
VVDRRSILFSTVSLFAAAILGALALFAATISWIVRRGKRAST